MIRPVRKPNGRYAVRWRENGRQRQQTFDNRQVAERFATKLNDRLQSHGLVDLDRGKITLAEFLETYWAGYAIPNLKPNTRETYKRIWAKHLLPRIGGKPLRELTPKRLAGLRAELDGKVGDPTILKAFTLLGSVFSYAVVEEELDRNPLLEVKKPAQRREMDIVVPTPEQVEGVRWQLLTAGDRRSAMIVSLLAYGGLRTFSEIHLLEWRHVGQRALRVYATKTSRGDVVKMLAPLAQDLAEWRMACGRPGPRMPVIARPDGEPLRVTDWRNWRRRVYRPMAETVGLDSRRPYDLRHALASLLIWEGRSLADVAAVMRHSVATCAQNYVHVLEEFDPEARMPAVDRIRLARAVQREREMG